MWQHGEPLLLTFRHKGRVHQANVVRLVRDEPDIVALFWGAGYPMKAVAESHAERRRIHFEERDYSLVETVWEATDVLCLIRPEDGFSSWLMWRGGTGEEVCWYINLQAPLQPTPGGFESRDFELDIVVQPDLESWRWKDEDDFRKAQEKGWLSPEEAETIRAEGERALESVRERQPPFDGSWSGWRPEPGWGPPQPPVGWDEL